MSGHKDKNHRIRYDENCYISKGAKQAIIIESHRRELSNILGVPIRFRHFELLSNYFNPKPNQQNIDFPVPIPIGRELMFMPLLLEYIKSINGKTEEKRPKRHLGLRHY